MEGAKNDVTCAICGRTTHHREPVTCYPGQVCEDCDADAINRQGKPPEMDSVSETGDNPVYIRGLRCYRRYRFGGYVTMRDASAASDIIEFQNRHIDGEWAKQLLAEAIEALAAGVEPIADGFGLSDKPSVHKNYRGCVFHWRGKPWVACRTALVSGNARLIDAATAFRLARGAEGAVAILDPPEGRGGDSSGTPFFERYRDVAWHALRVVWMPADRLGELWTVSALPPSSHGDWLDDLCEQLRPRLADGVRGFHSSSSRDAEQLLLPIVDRELTGFGFVKGATQYESFWRSPMCDGAWDRAGAAPRRLALEVKVTEDLEAPFCQVMENLGTSDAVLYVRLINDASRVKEERMQQLNPAAMRLRDAFERVAPVRYLDIAVV